MLIWPRGVRKLNFWWQKDGKAFVAWIQERPTPQDGVEEGGVVHNSESDKSRNLSAETSSMT